MTRKAQRIRVLRAQRRRAVEMCAIELLVAAQAIELHGTAGALQPPLAAVLGHVRAISPALEHDRPLGRDLDALAGAIRRGAFAPPAP